MLERDAMEEPSPFEASPDVAEFTACCSSAFPRSRIFPSISWQS